MDHLGIGRGQEDGGAASLDWVPAIPYFPPISPWPRVLETSAYISHDEGLVVVRQTPFGCVDRPSIWLLGLAASFATQELMDRFYEVDRGVPLPR